MSEKKQRQKKTETGPQNLERLELLDGQPIEQLDLIIIKK
jgi:hypothetical protein